MINISCRIQNKNKSFNKQFQKEQQKKFPRNIEQATDYKTKSITFIELIRSSVIDELSFPFHFLCLLACLPFCV
jgi:hypothetical protein